MLQIDPYFFVWQAGIVKGALIQECSDSNDELTIAVNTMAHIWMTKAFLPGMEQRGRGHFCQISSFAAYVAAAGMVSYAASKYGARGYAEGLAAELRHRKSPVRVTCVCPSHIETELFKGFKVTGASLFSLFFIKQTKTD